MAYENITLDVSPEGTAVLTLNRPAKRNAFNAPTIEELSDAFETLSKNPECRLLLIRGAGPVFSAGADLEWMKAASHYSERENEEDAYAMAQMLRQLFELPQITIALLHGAAMAGACCSMRSSTAGVKNRPSAVPIAHSPAQRTGAGHSRRTPDPLAIAHATRGPIIQGNGAFSAEHSAPAGTAIASARANAASAVTIACSYTGDSVRYGCAQSPSTPSRWNSVRWMSTKRSA